MLEFDLFKASVLALIQGFTEFLPVSSSAHLILPSELLAWEDQGLVFDVAVHFGTLLAVIIYFRQDLLQISRGLWTYARYRKASTQSTLGIYLCIATLPAGIAGILLNDFVDLYFRHVEIIIATTILFALLLWLADRHKNTYKNLDQMNLRTALIIGCSQVLALIPGTSRSGVTMTAALFCDLSREAASRFSFLLSIPLIAGAGLLTLLDLLQTETMRWGELTYALLLAMITAYICIHYFLRLINRVGFMPFVIYRLLLGALLLLFVLL